MVGRETGIGLGEKAVSPRASADKCASCAKVEPLRRPGPRDRIWASRASSATRSSPPC